MITLLKKDRAFLAEPNTMLKAFYTGGTIAFFFIVVFGLIGVFGHMLGTLDDTVNPSLVPGLLVGEPPAIAKFFGRAIYSVTNIIFLTTSISTVDSTFASTAKLSAEVTSFLIKKAPARLTDADEFQLRVGRFAIRFMAFLGTLPLLQNPTALSATTISGTMVSKKQKHFILRWPNSSLRLLFVIRAGHGLGTSNAWAAFSPTEGLLLSAFIPLLLLDWCAFRGALPGQLELPC